MTKEQGNNNAEMSVQVCKIISEQLAVPEASVTTDMALNALGADSLDVVELVMRFEDEFDIEIKDEDVETLVTVADVIQYLQTMIEQQRNTTHI